MMVAAELVLEHFRSCSLTNRGNTNTTSSVAIVLITVFYKVTSLTVVIDVLSNGLLGCVYSCNARWIGQDGATLVSVGEGMLGCGWGTPRLRWALLLLLPQTEILLTNKSIIIN